MDVEMLPTIKKIEPLKVFKIHIEFDDGKCCIYDVGEDIKEIKAFEDLKRISALFEQVQLDESRTCIYWNDVIDIASDTIYEYGIQVQVMAWLKNRIQITIYGSIKSILKLNRNFLPFDMGERTMYRRTTVQDNKYLLGAVNYRGKE